MALTEKIIGAESGGQRFAKNPRSTAYGPGQFLESTWMMLLEKYRPELLQGRSRAEILEMRSDPALSREMTENYTTENKAYLAKRGLEPDDANAYAAYFLGPAGAAKVLSSNASSPVSSLVGSDVIEANPFLARMTVGDFMNWTQKKMGDQSGAATATASAPTQRQTGAGLLDPLLGMQNGQGLGDVAMNAVGLTPGADASPVADRSLTAMGSGSAYDRGGMVGMGMQALGLGDNTAAEALGAAIGLPPGISSAVSSFLTGGGSGGGSDPGASSGEQDAKAASNAAQSSAQSSAGAQNEAMTASMKTGADALTASNEASQQAIQSLISGMNTGNVDLTRLAQILRNRSALGTA